MFGIDAGLEVWKRQVAVGDVGRVAGLVVPGLEVRDLAPANAPTESAELPDWLPSEPAPRTDYFTPAR